MKRLSLGLVGMLIALLATAPATLAASCNGASHDMTLSNGTASPGAGTTSTVVTFSVRYTDNAGCAPTTMTLTIPGVGTIVMSSNQTAYAGGVVFSRALNLPPGTHAYSFSAASGSGRGERSATLSSVSPSSVVIHAPPPPPTPTPAPTASPVPTAPPPPATPPPPPPRPPAATPTPRATAAPAAATAPPTPSASTAPVVPVAPLPSASPAITPPASSAASSSPAPSASGSASLVPAASPSDAPIADAGGLTIAGLDQLDGSNAVLVAIIGGTGAWFLVAARRRRHAGGPAAAPRVAASAMPGAEQAPDDFHVTPLPDMRELIPPVDPRLLDGDDIPGDPAPGEANVPRWLRPSVREARFAGDRDRRNWH